MKLLVPIALASVAFAQAPMGMQTTAGPLAREHWQRTLLLPAGHPAVEQCVVLDADLFANAAPGLRDVRLLQGDRELQYAVAESHDDRETVAEPMPADDRSVFDVVAEAPLGGEMAQAAVPNTRVATFVLPAHVPVERITLSGALQQPADVQVRATPTSGTLGSGSPESEVVALMAHAGQASLPVTLGANLQKDATVSVSINSRDPVNRVKLEMRRRELCYKPITDAPVRMVYGDSEAQSIHYDYALRYKPTATPVLATMGPREANPLYEPPVAVQPFFLTLRQRLGIAIGLCVGMIFVTFAALARMLRKHR
jgi:hypothetical protein